MIIIYTDFAYIYDRLTYDIDYCKWASYIEGIFKKNKVKPTLIADLGCGTGSFCIEMSNRGYDMIGIDLSADMLSCAQKKAESAEKDILFLNQDMTQFELFGTVDVIVSLLDSMNYITDKRKLKKIFKLVKNYLNPDGLFIFDINTPYKLLNVLGNNMFYEVDDDITYIWENSIDKKRNVCTFDITFFIRDGDKYIRHEEIHDERAYSFEELNDIICDAGLELCNIYDDLSYNKPNETSNRAFFVVRKVK